ncbi:unnamed protein product, partial [Rotaria sordida]
PKPVTLLTKKVLPKKIERNNLRSVLTQNHENKFSSTTKIFCSPRLEELIIFPLTRTFFKNIRSLFILIPSRTPS